MLASTMTSGCSEWVRARLWVESYSRVKEKREGGNNFDSICHLSVTVSWHLNSDLELFCDKLLSLYSLFFSSSYKIYDKKHESYFCSLMLNNDELLIQFILHVIPTFITYSEGQESLRIQPYLPFSAKYGWVCEIHFLTIFSGDSDSQIEF